MNMRSALHILALTIAFLSSDFLHPAYGVLFQYIHNLGEFRVILVVVFFDFILFKFVGVAMFHLVDVYVGIYY